jgi:hypothetical protein
MQYLVTLVIDIEVFSEFKGIFVSSVHLKASFKVVFTLYAIIAFF